MCFYKLGLELFMSGGAFELLDWMVGRGNKVFLDLKLFDVPATVAAVGDVVDPVTRTIKVRAWVNNEAHKLKPEMFARLLLDVGDAQPFITVPREAVLEADGKQFVYVVESPDRYVKREVKVSNISPDQVRVLEGLARGQRIVTKGAVLIKNQDVKAS